MISTSQSNAEAARRQVGMTRRRFLLGAGSLAAAAWVAPAWSAEQAPEVTVTLERRGDEIEVKAFADIAASIEQTWKTLADYDHLAEFIPGMSLSRTVSRTGASALVEQNATASFGPFTQKLALLLAVDEVPFESIHAAIVKGDFRRFDARYDVVALDAGRTRLDYRARLEPGVPVPPVFGVAAMRGQIRRQFAAMVAEIARRGASA